MSDVETLAERVRTVERAVTDGDHTFPAVDDLAELDERIDALERELENLEERTTELEGATQALRGYVGNVRSVNERVEQRADTALAATERLERRLDESDRSPDERRPQARETTDTSAGVRQAATNESAEPPDIGTPSTDTGTGNATAENGSDGATDTGVLQRIRSLL
jgi:chromosome segregation ATPase